MPRVLQLRGINCSGKTTACYGYARKHGPIEAYDVWAGDKYLPVTVTADAVMLGDYTVVKQTAEADCYQSNKRLFTVLEEVMREWPGRDIVFEGYIFGKSIKLAVDLDRMQPKVVAEGVSSPVEDTSCIPVCEMHRLIEGYLRWK